MVAWYAPVSLPPRRRSQAWPPDWLAGLGDLVAAGWVVEEKRDGVWALAEIDAAGRVASLTSREGLPLRPAWVEEFIRERVRSLPPRPIRTGRRGRPRLERREVVTVEHLATGLPPGRYVAELDAHTRRAGREIRRRGYAALWLRDAVEIDGRDLRRLPRRERRRLLDAACAGVEDRTHGRVRLLPERVFVDPGAVARFALSLVDAGGEGVVAHDQAAPYGQRGAAVKFKPIDTTDLQVVEVYDSERGTRKATLAAAHPIPEPDGSPRLVTVQTVTVPRGLVGALVPGAIVEVAHGGPTGLGPYRHGRLATVGPRGARVLRVRDTTDKAEPDLLHAEDPVPPEVAARRLGICDGTLRTWAGDEPGLRIDRGIYDRNAIDRARSAGLGRKRGSAYRRPVPLPAAPAFAVVDLRAAPAEVRAAVCSAADEQASRPTVRS